MTNLIEETRIAKCWFAFEAFEPATVIIRVSGMSMVWNPQSMNIITAHEPAAVIIRVSDMSMVWNPQSMNIITAHEPAAVIISRFWYIQGTEHSVYEYHYST
ncbi:hypothetical protein DPMN_018821 [Dreissena polymorpha]|uniref:Uncharacterized protein n=1 Tax=Dreissena polymorpha TaxID=45954 RepID=A0A9D4NJI6_DREPO|nr:hypothetical protein DPMN_018821 [Dreissena polymorpha]